MAADWTGAIERARAHSPFLARGLERQPELAALLAGGEAEAALAWARAAGGQADDVGVKLRRERLALATALGIGDLAGALPLQRVMAELSDFADRALDQAIAAAIRRRMPDAKPAGFVALALGKHGAQELNYSSDIDPILLYDPQLLPRRERDDPGEAAQRVARALVELLSAVTEEGYVFRVDLRLRPAAEVSPLALSFDAALSHYESSALSWERAAFIRARAAAGDVAEGQAFLKAISPFVWRRSLDFGAIEEVRRLTLRIRANQSGPGKPGPGFDLKLGRGGIREIEFFAQTHQLIHGGRDPSLRVRGTRAALDALAAAGLVAAADAQLLGESYDRLRALEHRLQMVGDRQTHEVPQQAAQIENVALLADLASGEALLAELTEITAAVAARYDALIADDAAPAGKATPGRAPSLAEQAQQFGLPEPERLAERVAGWRAGRIRALRSDAARAAFDAILPTLLEGFAKAPDPARAIARWETVLANLPSVVNLLRLLEARPGLLDLLLRILTLAPPLADALARHAELLDPLIDASAFDLPGPVAELAARMAPLDCSGDYQDRLDRIRRVVGEVQFALGVQLIEGAHDPLAIAAALSRTAEAAIGACVALAEEEFAQAHGRVPGGELLVLGLGRLGGGLLTHASDLDLVYLFTGDWDARSDGPRPLGAVQYFNRLAQRVTAALSVPTAAGALYEVDLRLRPEGNQGPTAVSCAAFARYQTKSAWAWEHMALTRARVIHGPAAGRAELERILSEVLRQPRDGAELQRAVLAMRAEMAQHKAPAGPLDAKLLRGGLVDLEFIVHFRQLQHGVGLDPDLAVAIGELRSAGLVPESLGPAYAVLSKALVAGRLLAPDCREPPPVAAAALAQACDCPDYQALFAQLAAARRAVAAAWHEIFATELEID